MEPESNPEKLDIAMARNTVNWGEVRMLIQEIARERKQAAAVAKRLLGNRPTRKACPNCGARRIVQVSCGTCFGTGEVLNDY